KDDPCRMLPIHARTVTKTVFLSSDRILVLYEGEIVGEFDPKQTTVQELGLYMAGAKRMDPSQMSVFKEERKETKNEQ
ncbi:MAG: hypothetical protein II581_02430, partial [Oscillospiraceae bacterium]|nr:hypothetical protein [Oscillospiraceae bacterium]